jgi:hypothetical protein
MRRAVGGPSRPAREARRQGVPSDPFDFPTRPGATKASGVWVGEALVDTAGKIRQVWTLRSFHFEPAWPEFDDAITAGIRKWTYEPAVVDGAAVPVCITVSVNIDWR